MKKDDPQLKPQPSGDRPPPRPPRRAAVELDPEGDDSDKKQPATITKAAKGEGRFIRQSGGRGHYGHVIIEIEPNGRGKGVEIISNVLNSAIPARYIEAVTDGIRYALDVGAFFGNPLVDRHPIVDIVVRIVDGSFHEIDSSDMTFKMAGIFAIKDALINADPIIIE
jgi:elongation factor G